MAVFEFPTSFAQRRLWLLGQLDPGLPTYNVGWALWLDGPLDVAALHSAWQAALGRHETLRTTFRNEAGLPVQVVDDEVPTTPVDVVDLTHLDEPKRENAARALLREHASVPFDLNVAPLVRTCLLRLSSHRHVLGVVAHHIVADGWSFRLLFDQLAADYTAALAGTAPVTPEPPIQYADFTLWQIEHAEAGGYAGLEEFWQRELADAPQVLPLPTDHPYPPRQTFNASSLEVRVPAGTTGALRRLAAERGTTAFTVLLAAYAALLSRLTGGTDLLVGVPVAGRTRPETEPVVGLFMNTLAVRVRLDGEPTLDDLVTRVHTATAAALAHQELPFARVVELCRPERDQARGPLVQVMFALEEPFATMHRGGLRWRPELVDNGTVKVELDLVMVDGPDSFSGQLRYNRDLFDATTAQRFVDGLDRILTALATAPHTRVGDVDILSPATRELVTVRWARGEALPDGAATATALVAAACTGEQVVARAGGVSLTGAQLRSRARQVAAGLVGAGTAVQDRVGILLPRDLNLLPALLGVWWLGAAYVPLDPTHPPQRLQAMARDADVRTIITDTTSAEVAAALEELRADMPDLKVVDLGVAGEPAASVVVPDEPYDLPPTAAAYTIFTSGSTGRPKAVVVPQGAVSALLRAFRAVLPLGQGDRLVAITTLAFDISVLELLLPLVCGAEVVIAGQQEATDGARLRQLLLACDATALQATPATWRMLLAAGGVPAGLRLRLCGGEALPRDLADAIGSPPADSETDVALWNLYGPTETTVWSTAGPVTAGTGPVEVGPALPGTQVYILDPWLRPVPPGVVGEVYLGGAGVGHGYPGAAALTAQRFLPDPFGGAPGARIYRTGDLGRWRGPGRIELIGRVDRQVKLRGFRIETAEVEAVLRTHPEIVDAVVTLRPGPDGEALVGYVVTGHTELPAGLREHLCRLLPDYMVPAAFVALAELPRTPGGKVDHLALPEPVWGDLTRPVIMPRTPLESELAQAFAELLQRTDPVGVHDNFFALGGHSLTATRLMVWIWSTYGVDLPIRVLFADPTVAGLARAVEAAETESDLVEEDVDELLRTLITDERS